MKKPIQPIVDFLRKKIGASVWLHLLGAAGLLPLSALVLFATFWFVYAVIWFGFDWLFPHSHATRLWISGLILVLLFIGNARTDRSYLESYSFTTGTTSNKIVTIDVPGVGAGSNVNPLAPDTAHSYVKMIVSLLYTGPRTLTAAYRLCARALRMRALDIEACAAVIAFLKTKDARVEFKEACQSIPKGKNVSEVLEQLREFDGIMFLTSSEPAGLSLTSEFRKELRGAR